MTSRVGQGRRTAWVAGALAAVLSAVLAAGCASTEAPPKPGGTASPSSSTESVTFAVYGPKTVTDAYADVAAAYNADHPTTRVSVKRYATHDEALRGLRAAQDAGDPPDVFLMDHDDLAALSEDKMLRRVDDLLAERRVDFGDGFSRGGLEAFSADAALQCMPWDVSPLVVYYNPALIDLDALSEQVGHTVSPGRGWTLDEFAQAALQARRPGVRGLYVAPELQQVAPFVWSGGGEIVDDEDDPTRLTLADGSSLGALEKLLVVVRDPALTFGPVALRRESALDRFKAGKLGMILGFRDLTPELRDEPGLTFDVMPLPRISSGATIATMSGLCLSKDSDRTGAAADFLAALISKTGSSMLAETGYVMPANLDVLNSDTFLQPTKNPPSAAVFTREVRDTRLLPSTPRGPVVRRAVARELTQLFYQPAILPSLQERLQAIDEASVPLFDPTKTFSPSASPSPTPGG